jgi:hypothetical protein
MYLLIHFLFKRGLSCIHKTNGGLDFGNFFVVRGHLELLTGLVEHTSTR